MFDVIEKKTGKRVKVYAVIQNNFLVIDDEHRFRYRGMEQFVPVSLFEDEKKSCTFIAAKKEKVDLADLLDGIMSGEIQVDLGSTIETKLLDGTELDLVVTDQDDNSVRLESRDCLGINTSADNLHDYLVMVYNLLPEALKKRIIEVEREHFDSNGKRFKEKGKLFVPAASEIFPPDECYGDKGLYKQMDWYKDVHNRVRAENKGGYSHWYWTSSVNSGSCFCIVGINGTAFNYLASAAYGLAPFGCILPKTK